MERLYTTKTHAALVQVSPSTIRREIDEGRISWFKVRGQIRCRESDVHRHLCRRQLKRKQFETADILYLPSSRRGPAKNG